MATRRCAAALVAVVAMLTSALVSPSATITLASAQSTEQIRQLWKAHQCKLEEMVTIEVDPAAAAANAANAVKPGTQLQRTALVLVHKLAEPFFVALHEIFADYDWSPDPDTTGGWICRDNVSVKGKKSLHAFGIAADYEWDKNHFIRSMAPPNHSNINLEMLVDIETKIRTTEDKFVFRWGGNFKDKKSPMHFEIVLGPDDLAKGIKDYKLSDSARRLLGIDERRAARLASLRQLLEDSATTEPTPATTEPAPATDTPTTASSPPRDKEFDLGSTFRDLFKSSPTSGGVPPIIGSLLDKFLGGNGDDKDSGSAGGLADVVSKLPGLLDRVSDKAKKHLEKLGTHIDKHAGEGTSAGPLDMLNGLLDKFTNHVKTKVGKGGAGSILDSITGLIKGGQGDGKGGGKLVDTIKDLFGNGDIGGNIKNALDLFMGNSDGIVDKLKDVKVLGKLLKNKDAMQKLIETFRSKGKLADKIEAVSGLFGPKVRQHKEHFKALADSISNGDFKGSLTSVLGLIKKFQNQKDDIEIDVPDDIKDEEGTDADIPPVTACSAFKWCPKTHFTLKDGEGKGCPQGKGAKPCSKKDCCAQRASCATVSCPQLFKKTSTNLCAGSACQNAECCVADDTAVVVGDCNNMECGANRARKTGGKCAGADCLEDECCDPAEPPTIITDPGTGFVNFRDPPDLTPKKKKYVAPYDGRMTDKHQSTEDEEVDENLASFPLFKIAEKINEPITEDEQKIRDKAKADADAKIAAAKAARNSGKNEDNSHIVMIIGVVMGVIFAVVAIGVVIRMRQKHVAQQNEFHAWQNNVYDQKQQAAHAAAAAADKHGVDSRSRLPGSLADYNANPASLAVALHTGTDTQNFYRQSRLYSDIPSSSKTDASNRGV